MFMEMTWGVGLMRFGEVRGKTKHVYRLRGKLSRGAELRERM
jgi:hypothetical protein